MYKIELRTPGGRLVKSKTYHSEKLYNHWFMQHTASYGGVYDVTGFKWVDESWKAI